MISRTRTPQAHHRRLGDQIPVTNPYHVGSGGVGINCQGRGKLNTQFGVLLSWAGGLSKCLDDQKHDGNRDQIQLRAHISGDIRY